MCLCLFGLDDVVYLPDESLLQEYIMNEDGVIFMGAWDYIRSIPWTYGQVTLSLCRTHTHTQVVCGG